MAKPTASFNGYDLASYVPGLIIVATNPWRFPDRNLNTQQISGADKSVLTSGYFSSKKINITCEIGRNTRELFDAAIDSLMAFIAGKEKTLLVNYGSSTRKWTATVANVAISDVQGGHGLVDIEFECSDPMGYDNSSTPVFSTNRTGSTSTESFTLGGTAEKQQLIITLTLSALTGGAAKTVSIGNPATSQQVDITRTWTAGDVIVIDPSSDEPVTVNGAQVAFSGAIPEWAPGAGSISYSDDLTTRTRAFSAVYYKRYL